MSYILILILNSYFIPSDLPVKFFNINGRQVKVTHQVDKKFLGTYSGSKGGYLILKEDGTGEYFYDEQGIFMKNCNSDIIKFEWGFIVDDRGEIVRFERDYGYSYPVIYLSTHELSFRDCSKSFMVDYILDKKNGIITISSSSDWEKE